MNSSLSFKKRSVIFNWLFSYVIFLIIFIVVSFLIYFNTTKIIENEIIKANNVLLKSTQNDMDEILKDARKVSVEALFNYRIQSLLNYKNEISDAQYFDIYKLLQDFRIYATSYKTIDNMYIVLKKINKVVSLNGITDINAFFNMNYPMEVTTYNNWLHEYDERKVEKYSLVFAGKKTVQRKILYMRSLSTIDNKDLTNCITVEINEARLTSQLSIVDTINKGTSFIIDNDNKIVTSFNPITLPQDFNLNSTKKSDVIYTKFAGKNVVISFIASTVNDWKYVTIVPESVFLEKVNLIKTITYSGIFFSFILGAILIYYFLRKNYNPINKLLNILINQPNFINEDKNNNEYTIIENGLKNAIEDRNSITTQLNSQNLMLRIHYIEKLLKGIALDDVPVNEALNSYNITFNSNYFTVVLLYLEYFPKDDTALSNFNDIRFIFSNIIEELIGQNHNGFMIEVDGNLVCLININKNRLAEVSSDLLKAIENSQEFISQKFHIKFTASIGAVHEDIDKIHLCYNESLEAMNYKKVLGIKHTLCFEDIDGNYHGTYYYPLNKEQQLINFIKCGEYDGAKLTVDEIFEINFVKNQINVDLTQCLMLNMVSTMIRAVNEVSNHSKNNFLEDLNPLSRLLPCKSVEEMKNQLVIFLETFCNHMNQINNCSSNWVVNDVVPYIQKNYNDINLSVSVLAEKFDVHPVYISKVFKDEVGDGLLDFINKTRIKNSLILLKERKECNLDEISKEVGFSNVRTFSRVFKKYEGISPGKFKNMI